MIRPVRNPVVIVIVVAVLAAGIVTLWAWHELTTPGDAWAGGPVIVDLPRGLHAGAMFNKLHEEGVLRAPGLLRIWVGLRGGGERLHAGEYRFERPMSSLAVLAKLERGDVVLHSMTLPEGLDIEEAAARVAEAGFGDVAEVLAVFRDPGPIREIDPAAADLEGYLFPDTYQFPRGTPPSRVARTMVARFSEVTGQDYVERAKAVGLSLREAVTLASMIEKETSLPEERGRISRVFHNRLDRRMLMQCDPTVRYALKREGREVARLTYRDLEFDSPWNTYVVAGLPPGPIASPGWESLEAAVDPVEGDELYFVATPGEGGGHTFSRDLRSHQNAVRDLRRYQSSIR
jgi:UPF0755 protein